MYETLRIVEKLKPKYVIWENVKNILSKKHKHNFDNYLEKMKELGYTNYYQVLNAKDYGIPQNRERVFTISIKEFAFPEKQELKLRLKDMLEKQADEKFYLTSKQIEQINNWKSYRNPINEAKQVDDETSFCITAKSNTGLNASMLLIKENEDSFVSKKYKEFISKNGYIPEMFNPYNETEIKEIAHQHKQQIRKLTPKECWRLMGFTDEEFEKAKNVNSNTQLYKQAGNSIVVNVLEKILKNLFEETQCIK